MAAATHRVGIDCLTQCCSNKEPVTDDVGQPAFFFNPLCPWSLNPTDAVVP